jgi:hypothetical protein
MTQPAPPRPRAAFRVAVLGHRRDKLPSAADPAVRGSIAIVLDRIAGAVDSHRLDCSALYRDEPPRLTCFSALAEGADRLGAEVALADSRWELHAVLPFREELYRADFSGGGAEAGSPDHFDALLAGASRVTVLDGRAGKWDAYVPLGRTLVESADLVIVVWDGGEARGPGGTANVVRQAREAEVPIVRIAPDATGEAWLEELLDDDHGRALGLSRLPGRLSALLQPPSSPGVAERWFSERGGPRRVPGLFDLLIRVMARLQRVPSDLAPPHGGVLAKDPGAEGALAWQGEWAELPPTVAADVVRKFGAQFGWADALGRWYAAAFRSSFSAVFLLAVASVVTGGLLHLQPAVGRSPAWLVIPVLEPLLLGAMLWIVWRSRTRGYHERWLDYRSLAERTRHLATLWPMARTPSVVRVPPGAAAFDPRLGWVGWLLRATAREAGLVSGHLDGAYALAARQLVLRRESSEQRAFHFRRRTRLERLSGPLEMLAQHLVAVALVLSLLRLGELGGGFLAAVASTGDKSQEVGMVSTTWVIIAAAATGLPALAAGIHGFLGIADFEGTALRSAAIEGRLGELEGRLHRLEPVDLTGVGDLTVEMTRTMEGELGAWHSAAASRRLQAN